jgi:hypothetical protein
MKKLLFAMLALALWVGCGRPPAPSPRPGESRPSQRSVQYWPTEASGKKPAYGLPLVIQCDTPKVPTQLLKPSPPIEDLR